MKRDTRTDTNIKDMIITEKKAELLSPAGSLDICKAVINAGADAVYLGGKSFSARAYAGNLTSGEIIEAIDYAHLRCAKIYLTLNTLLKENEIIKVIPFLKELYEAGLDAVIVQDYGCMRLIREAYPDLHVHASTQMAVMTSYFADHLKSLGVRRVVLPREMTLDEIKSIYDKTGLELEVFVHGALCYSYSGLCLFSSMHGQRSGNRGSCAQPCRLEFSGGNSTGRLLCTKDIAALRLIPDIIEAGACSLKIEGRMKNVYYAAGVTHIYRKYLDSFYRGDHTELFAREGEEDIKKLAALYNRGSFSEGLFAGEKGLKLMSPDRPNNRGLAALKTLQNKKGHLTFEAVEDIHKGDVFELSTGSSFTSGKEVSRGGCFEIDLPEKYAPGKGDIIYRMNDKKLQDFISKSFVEENKKIHIDMKLTAIKGDPAVLKINHPETGCSTELSGELVQAAKTKGADKDDLKKRLCKLGATDFACDNISVNADDDIFISNGGLNELRRRGIAQISAEILNLSKKNEKNNFLFANNGKNAIIGGSVPERLAFSALINTAEQLDAVKSSDVIDRLYINLSLLRELAGAENRSPEDIRRDISLHCKKELFAVLPFFFRERHRPLFHEDMKLISKLEPDGILVRSADQLAALDAVLSYDKEKKPLRIASDYQVYAYNSISAAFIDSLIRSFGFMPDVFTAPVELTGKEISDIGLQSRTEAVCYGRMVLMISEHCVRKTLDRCGKRPDETFLRDSQGRSYPVISDCRYCNNVILDHSPVDLLREFKEKTDIKRLRIDLTDESGEETLKILSGLSDCGVGGLGGHSARFYTGVL